MSYVNNMSFVKLYELRYELRKLYEYFYELLRNMNLNLRHQKYKNLIHYIVIFFNSFYLIIFI